jgi:hypothetical protein
VIPTVTAGNVDLDAAVDIDADGVNETTVQDAITELIAALTVAQAPLISSVKVGDVTQTSGNLSVNFLKNTEKTFEFIGANFNSSQKLVGLPSEYSQEVTAITTTTISIKVTASAESSAAIVTLSNHTTVPSDSEPIVMSLATIDLGIGNEFEGGVIFYLDQVDVGHGLIVAMEDLGSYNWGCWAIDFDDKETAIGSWNGAEWTGGGKANTDAYKAAGCSTDSDMIINALDDFNNNGSNGGYSDWFIPSKDELSEIFSVLPSLNFNTGKYWSSSGDDTYSAWYVDFPDGNADKYAKLNPTWVRVIRAF